MSGDETVSSRDISPAVDFTAGVIAGEWRAAGLVVGQPLDVVKVRYQTPDFAGKYTSIYKAFGAIIKEEKVHGLFKGVLSPMAGIGFINGVVFTSYSFFIRLQHPQNGTGAEEAEPSLTQICLAGAGSGFMGAFLTCPTELIKIKQQSAPPHLDPSTLDVVRQIVHKKGFRGLYRGFSATAIRDLAFGPYFCTYEAVCRWFRSRKRPPEHLEKHRKHGLIEEAEAEMKSLNWAELMTAGGLAGVTAWLVTFPADVFKTRMQSVMWTTDHVGRPRMALSSRIPGQPLHRIAIDAVKNEGWRVCFAGLGPTLIRAVPVNMVIFLTFEGIVAGLTR